MKKNGRKQALQWVLALLAGSFLVNALCFFYERQPGWLDTPRGASASVWRPGAVIVHGTEGFGISKVDDNGYLNPAGALADRYVLMMGASHTQGKEVSPPRRYSSLVNDYFSGDSGLLTAYNIASDGHFLPGQIQYFLAAVSAFPNAGAITMEISSTDVSPQELRSSRNQVVYDPSGGDFEALSGLGRLRLAVKEGFPLLSLLKKNMQTLRAQAAEGNEGPYDYETELDAALALIRSEFDGPIAFVYHPSTEIQSDGTLKLGYSDTWKIFCKVCERNGIDVIDTGERFQNLYDTQRKLPYGFANTTPGSGHLNALGHEILAEEIISYLEELRS
ncbi:MAG: hypothetical protein Q4F81_10200 [Eubacteriales bacterium]|nr:hypothetical protein [Eubacteriales bacterium]